MNRNGSLTLSVMLGTLMSGAPGNAYELNTHSRITQAAMVASQMYVDQTPPQPRVLNREFFRRLGLEHVLTPAGSFAEKPFGELYYDVFGTATPARSTYTFDTPSLPRQEALSASGWLVRGAIREDDLAAPIGKNPRDDPYGNFMRVLHHFYDPVLNRPLTTVLGPMGEKAPDWSMGVQNAFADPLVIKVLRRNHFTVVDAREAMYRALTGLTRSGLDAGPEGTEATQAVRNAYWATTFRALGDVLHLNQDMAQPQHTRNDPHSGIPGFGHSSVYESYIECRVTGRPTVLVNGGNLRSCAPMNFGGYPIPQFSRYSDYFSTREGLNGRGLADYSNRGFFSAGTNLGLNDYSAPANDPASFTHEQLALVQFDPDYPGLTVPVHVLKGAVQDLHTAQPATDVPLTTQGLWYKPLEELTGSTNARLYGHTLTRVNYDAMADLLIPRAVAYSAGLINHFFRGRLEISLPPEGVFSATDASITQQFTTLSVAVQNLSAGAEPMGGGEVMAVVRFHRNTCYQADLSGEYRLPGNEQCRSPEEEIVRSAAIPLTLPFGATRVLSFDFSADPIPHAATDIELQVVYAGALGSEVDAVVVGAMNLSEPTYFDIVNMTDYFLYEGTFYSVPHPFDQTTVPSQVDPVLFSYIDDNQNGRYDAGTDRNLQRLDLSYQLNVGGYDLAELTLPPSSFARLVVLIKADAPVPVVLSKLSYGYDFPLQLQPLINQAGSGMLPPTPGRTRNRYHYSSSPDHGFHPEIIPVPADLAPLSFPQPRPMTLNFPAP